MIVVAHLCDSLAFFLSISVFSRCFCVPVVVFQIYFIFIRANFTAGDGADRDEIEPSMEIVELMIDGGSGAEALNVVALRRRDGRAVATSYHTTAAPKNWRHASPGTR